MRERERERERERKEEISQSIEIVKICKMRNLTRGRDEELRSRAAATICVRFRRFELQIITESLALKYL